MIFLIFYTCLTLNFSFFFKLAFLRCSLVTQLSFPIVLTHVTLNGSYSHKENGCKRWVPVYLVGAEAVLLGGSTPGALSVPRYTEGAP